jgi:hypothetical protein
MNPGTSLFVPQGNIGVRDKGINTSPFTIHSAWVTAKRLKREKGDLLGVTHVITFFSDKWDPTVSPLQTALIA